MMMPLRNGGKTHLSVLSATHFSGEEPQQNANEFLRDADPFCLSYRMRPSAQDAT
jgi:hypothetical protein